MVKHTCNCSKFFVFFTFEAAQYNKMALLTDDVIEDFGVLSIIYVLGLKTTPKQSPKGRVNWFVLINVLKLDLFCLTILNLSVSFCYTEAHHQNLYLHTQYIQINCKETHFGF